MQLAVYWGGSIVHGAESACTAGAAAKRAMAVKACVFIDVNIVMFTCAYV